MSEQPKTPPWFKAPHAEVKARLRMVAVREDHPLSRVTWLWLMGQEAAQMRDCSGAHGLDFAELALLDHVSLNVIERIFAAFEAPDILLFKDGRCMTFKEKEKSRDQKTREKKAAERAAAVAAARDADPAICDPPATRDAPSASRLATESSESSFRTTVDLEDPPSVVVESHPSVRENETTTNEEIVRSISEVDPVKIPEKVVAAGIPEVRRWLADGVDLAADVLPEIAEIVRFSTNPIMTLKAPFIARQIAERRDRRLAAKSGPRAPPIGADAALPLGWTPQPYGARPNFELESLREMAGHG